MLRIILLLLFFCASSGVLGQWAGERRNLGPSINDRNHQVLPVFSRKGDTLYFSESLPDGRFGVRSSRRSRDSTWQPKQIHQQLNPATPESKFVYNQFRDGTWLVNGHLRRMGRSLLQSRGLDFVRPAAAPEFKPLVFSGADTVVNTRFTRACLFEPARLLFISMMRNGNEDLFVCPLLNPQESDWTRLHWGTPQRLTVSTPFTETAPYLSADGNTLYFASDRPGGEGGPDIYSCTRSGPGWTEWSVPRNLGTVINSRGNESSFTIDPWSGDACFVSDHNTFGGADIFTVQPDRNWKAGLPAQGSIADTIPTPADLSGLRPSNIVFLLDLSSSMKKGARMTLLKTAMRRLAQHLRPVDKVLVYRFAETNVRLHEANGVPDPARLLRLVDSLRPIGNATNGSSALMLGYQEALRRFIKDGNNQIFLVTDGDFPIWPAIEKQILETMTVQLSVVMIDETSEGQALLQKFRRFANVQVLSLRDVERDANVLLRSVQGNARTGIPNK